MSLHFVVRVSIEALSANFPLDWSLKKLFILVLDYSANNYDRSGAGTPSIVNQQKQAPPKHPPLFITVSGESANIVDDKIHNFWLIFQPLKDIAVVAGQTARFECIVQCDPSTSTFWMRNGQVIENSHKYQIEFRNGVCRLVIPQSYQGKSSSTHHPTLSHFVDHFRWCCNLWVRRSKPNWRRLHPLNADGAGRQARLSNLRWSRRCLRAYLFVKLINFPHENLFYFINTVNVSMSCVSLRLRPSPSCELLFFKAFFPKKGV